jgi:hypothetical protein
MFTVQCVYKDCGKLSTALIDKKTSKVYCADCQKELQVTIFAKNQLKHFKQYIDISENKDKNFVMTCIKCLNVNRPTFKDERFNCSSCKNELKPSKHFIMLFKQALKNVRESS